MAKFNLRKVYLYIFSMLGLILLIIAAVGLINLGLQLTFFRSSLENRYSNPPPEPYFLKNVELSKEKVELTGEQKEALEQWETDYKDWQENQKSKGYLPYVSESLSRDIALLIVGLPLYMYHWNLVKKDEQKEE